MGGSGLIGAAKVRRVARETGFREEVVEKVLYLSAIIERLRGHPDLKNAWVLKGGTAINLFYLEVPRLSIDIDINYIGSREVELRGLAERILYLLVNAMTKPMQVREDSPPYGGKRP
jgi:predicted nucleotidyltransferase component of viral defense system